MITLTYSRFLIRMQMLTYYIIISTVVVGLPCNLYCFIFYIRRKKDLGNAFLAYMNIADASQCLSDMVLFGVVFGKIDNTEFKVLALTVSSLIARSSITVTGVITIYLNLLRTSAIIWPMSLFNKKRLHLSLLVILVIFFIFEIAMGIFYSYPLSEYLNMPQGSTDVTMPFLVDHPLRLVFSNSFICFSIPIIFAVIVCCIASTAKLIQPDKNLSQNHDQGQKRRAATTVLILSIQYVVLNTCGFILFSLEDHFERVREKDQSEVKIPRFMLTNFAIALLHLNAILNPIVYICGGGGQPQFSPSPNPNFLHV